MLPLLKLPPWFAGQIGVPGSSSPEGFRTAPQGEVFYVDPSHPLATDGNDGVDPNAPLDTWAAAYARVVSGRGDMIRVMPGSYPENIVVAKDFLTIDGILTGYGRPDLEGNAGVALRVHAQGFRMRNVRVAAAANNVAVSQQGNGFHYENCVFDGDGAPDFILSPEPLDDTWTASEGLLLNNLFRGGTIGLRFFNPGPPAGVGPTDVQVLANRFYNHSAGDIDDLDTLGSNDTTFLDSLIAGNFFLEVGAAFVYIKLDEGGNNTGLISANYFADVDVTNAQIVIPAGIIQAGNYDQAGLVVL